MIEQIYNIDKNLLLNAHDIQGININKLSNHLNYF